MNDKDEEIDGRQVQILVRLFLNVNQTHVGCAINNALFLSIQEDTQLQDSKSTETNVLGKLGNRLE